MGDRADGIRQQYLHARQSGDRGRHGLHPGPRAPGTHDQRTTFASGDDRLPHLRVGRPRGVLHHRTTPAWTGCRGRRRAIDGDLRVAALFDMAFGVENWLWTFDRQGGAEWLSTWS